MTQKELSYVEDAIGHVGNISKILDESISNLEDENLVRFLEEEKLMHDDLKKELLEKLKEKANG